MGGGSGRGAGCGNAFGSFVPAAGAGISAQLLRATFHQPQSEFASGASEEELSRGHLNSESERSRRAAGQS